METKLSLLQLANSYILPLSKVDFQFLHLKLVLQRAITHLKDKREINLLFRRGASEKGREDVSAKSWSETQALYPTSHGAVKPICLQRFHPGHLPIPSSCEASSQFSLSVQGLKKQSSAFMLRQQIILLYRINIFLPLFHHKYGKRSPVQILPTEICCPWLWCDVMGIAHHLEKPLVSGHEDITRGFTVMFKACWKLSPGFGRQLNSIEEIISF